MSHVKAMYQIDFVYQDMIEDEKLNGAKLTLIETPSESIGFATGQR